MSTRYFSLVGALVITVVAAGCAQAGNGPTSPSAASAASAGAALGPGATYDASGMWHFVLTDVHGDVTETFDAQVSQDANGNLSFLDEDGALITLERLGTGVIITYRQFDTVAEGDCDLRIQAIARLDTRTNTLSGNVLLRALECSHDKLVQRVTGTKLS